MGPQARRHSSPGATSGPPAGAAGRVLLISQPTTEGVAVYVRDLARAAVESGRNVTVVCPATGELAGWAAQAGAGWVELALTRTPTLGDARCLARLRRLLEGVDLVHLHSSKAGAVGRLALLTLPPHRRPATVFTPHAWSWLAGGRVSAVYKTFEWAMTGVADTLVAVSDEEAALGVTALGRRGRTRLRVIPNGVDLIRFHPDGPKAPRRPEPLITCLGRLARQKGQDLAVRALAGMTTPHARLRLVGSGPDRESAALAALAADLGVADRVELPGPTEHPATELRTADVVVQPSRWDGLSLSLLEAMACGAAIVATSVAGTAVLSSGAGVVVPPEEPHALSAAMDDVLNDPAGRRALGAAARRKAEEECDVRLALAANLALWDETVVTRRPE